MMRKIKMSGMFVISVFVCSLFSVSSIMSVGAVDGFSAKDKMPALLSDVFGLDLSKYTITNEGYGVRYEAGGFIEVEQYVFTLVDAGGGTTYVGSEFYNGFPEWVNVDAAFGSMYYAIEPPKDSIEGMKNVFERYATFAQKYNITTIDTSLALNLLSKASSSLPSSELSPAKISSGDMSLYMSQKSFGFGSIVDGVNIPNKTWGISFMNDMITFHDVFELYGVWGLGVFSEEEFTQFAVDLAKKLCYASTFYDVDKDGVVVEVKPNWSKMRSDVSLLIIPGQFYNNSRNNDLLEQGIGVSMGNTMRDALTLYPLWTATVYFSQPIGNIDGQIGVWGDTKEIAYCSEYGFLGGSQYNYADVSSGQSNTYDNLIGIAIIALIVITSMAIVAVFIKKTHK